MKPPVEAPVCPHADDHATGFRYENLLRSDRLPHIWCPECGLGIAVSCFTAALERSGLDPD